jgi:hypothetical protein
MVEEFFSLSLKTLEALLVVVEVLAMLGNAHLKQVLRGKETLEEQQIQEMQQAVEVLEPLEETHEAQEVLALPSTQQLVVLLAHFHLLILWVLQQTLGSYQEVTGSLVEAEVQPIHLTFQVVLEAEVQVLLTTFKET